MKFRQVFTRALPLICGLALTAVASAADTIKVGILHSLSGTMAISETTLKDTVLMLIDEQNKKGGLLGKKLEPVVVDPASNWPLFAEKASELLEKDHVAVVFGCWTSVSRKSRCVLFGVCFVWWLFFVFCVLFWFVWWGCCGGGVLGGVAI